MIIDMVNFVWSVLKWPFYLVILVVVCFYVSVFIYFLYYVIVEKKRMKRAKSSHKYKRKKIPMLIFDFPKQVAYDMFSRNPDAFPFKGIVIFEGNQGDGKSISMIEFATYMKKKYPDVKTICNIEYDLADEKLTHWKTLLDFKNGEEGVIVVMDELQNWFSCKDSKDFPPEMLSIVTQNRKNRRIILGTAQSFYMLSKDIRTQCTEVRSCKTFCNALTFCIRKRPICDSSGEVIKWKFLGVYFYAHTPELRDSYNTYEVVERCSKVGFNERKIDMSQFM